jgi:DNA-binding NtrC family response regulator
MKSRYEDEMMAFKRELLMRVLIHFGGHQGQAAEYLGLHRNSVMRMMKECEINLSTVRFVCGCKFPRKKSAA